MLRTCTPSSFARTRGRVSAIQDSTEMIRPTPMKANLSMLVMATPVNSASTAQDMNTCTAMTTTIQPTATLRRNFEVSSSSHGFVVVVACGSSALR